uniref:Methyltransferase type 11 domain-containing protein n=1 Tax=Hemiselmis andersenii TaxID=464988 RepID=A0A7S1DV85_HEMAN
MQRAYIEYTAVEPNTFMHPAIETQMGKMLDASTPRQITQSISDIPSSSQDVVVSTLVLCSVDSQPLMLEEILRVLKPGGMLLFLEHVAADDQGYPSPYKSFDWGRGFYRWAQQAMTPLQVALADGCHPARDTVKEISTVFPQTFYKRFTIPDLWGQEAQWLSYFPIGPQVAGIAVKGKSKYAGQFAEVQFKFCAARAKPGETKRPLMATPDGDSDAQREWQESGGAAKALSAAEGLKCQ